LLLKGVISYLPTRYPSQKEVDNCRWLIVTSDAEWEPYDKSFEEKEDSLTPHPQERVVYELKTENLSDIYDIQDLIYQGCTTIASVSITVRDLTITDKMIALSFHCSPMIATKT
jgi:hypothetical protein